MRYLLSEIRERISPIARKYDIPVVYLFGSYARDQADEDSDIDVLIDKNHSKIVSLFDMGALYQDLDEAFDVTVDLLTTDALEQDDTISRTPKFCDNVYRERVVVYEGH